VRRGVEVQRIWQRDVTALGCRNEGVLIRFLAPIGLVPCRVRVRVARVTRSASGVGRAQRRDHLRLTAQRSERTWKRPRRAPCPPGQVFWGLGFRVHAKDGTTEVSFGD
jgi:hypothetical protein